MPKTPISVLSKAFEERDQNKSFPEKIGRMESIHNIIKDSKKTLAFLLFLTGCGIFLGNKYKDTEFFDQFTLTSEASEQSSEMITLLIDSFNANFQDPNYKFTSQLFNNTLDKIDKSIESLFDINTSQLEVLESFLDKGITNLNEIFQTENNPILMKEILLLIEESSELKSKVQTVKIAKIDFDQELQQIKDQEVKQAKKDTDYSALEKFKETLYNLYKQGGTQNGKNVIAISSNVSHDGRFKR